MRINELLWDDENVEHIAAHHVEIDEVEDVCYGRNLIERAGSGKHAILGQTNEGRYLFIVVARREPGRFRIITARDMTPAERRRFAERK